jgi:hypothetical protein
LWRIMGLHLLLLLLLLPAYPMRRQQQLVPLMR